MNSVATPPATTSPGTTAIATLGTVVLDCADPVALARFYAAITGWPASTDDPGWTQVEPAGGGMAIAFQQVDDYRAPEWPGQAQPQQFHLDFYLADLDAGEAAVLALGAVKHEHQPGTGFRVYLDPAGHPFCLCRLD